MLDKLEMNAATDFWFAGFNGDSVQGFLTLPPGFDSTKKYPLAFLIHGGPQWCWLQDFNYYGWNTQLMAAQGYVVAQVNPHGSVGYSQAFKEYVSGHWGKGDYQDLMLGVDYLLSKYPFIDSTRMAALGRSYGGFMINWICGHTDRFKCLVCIDGTFNHIADYCTTEELWFPEWEFKGSPWTNREEYIRSSPSTYVENFKTPTMVIHGELDYRVDPSEAFQMFTSLQRMGVPSQLLYYPDEGHQIHKLKNLRDVYQKQFEWLRRWLKE
jgi:dipeptidyl aminopeptidase/acylaminoacyl peptidase